MEIADDAEVTARAARQSGSLSRASTPHHSRVKYRMTLETTALASQAERLVITCVHVDAILMQIADDLEVPAAHARRSGSSLRASSLVPF